MKHLPAILLALTVAVIAVLYFADYRFSIGQDEAVKRELRHGATSVELDKRINIALDRDDVDDALMYNEIATYMQRGLPAETTARLAAAQTTAAVMARNAKGFARGFVTGNGLSMAELAGAVTSDLTVVGDVRDIAAETGKMVSGQEYSELVLGLSVLGVAATAATVATGGGGVVAKLGISILKVARRAGTLTADFAVVLTRMVREAVSPADVLRTLRGIPSTDLKATEGAVGVYARGVKQTRILGVLGEMGRIGKNAGPAESVRLLKFVHSADDLENIGIMSTRLGKKTRGIIELTGRTSLRAFKTALNVAEFLVERVVAFAAWLLGIFVLTLMRRLWRRRRRFAHA